MDKAMPGAIESAAGGAATRILIVDAHEENRALLKMLLEANGYGVTVAGDGIAALAAARNDPPGAVVSEVLMPGMDGFALCRAWMADAALKFIPFVFYSGHHVRPDEEQHARALGAARFIAKPLQTEALLRELRAVLAAPHPGAPAA
ncbi:MAG: response regulator [Acidobacteriota bacterium]